MTETREAQMDQVEAKKKKRSRIAEEVIRLARQGMSVACIAAATRRSPSAVRQILSRQGVSVSALREERRARPRPIQDHSPAARLARQLADASGLREVREAAEEITTPLGSRRNDFFSLLRCKLGGITTPLGSRWNPKRERPARKGFQAQT